MVFDDSENVDNFNYTNYYNNIDNNNILLSNNFCNKYNIKRTGINNLNFIKKKKIHVKKIQKKKN